MSPRKALNQQLKVDSLHLQLLAPTYPLRLVRKSYRCDDAIKHIEMNSIRQTFCSVIAPVLSVIDLKQRLGPGMVSNAAS